MMVFDESIKRICLLEEIAGRLLLNEEGISVVFGEPDGNSCLVCDGDIIGRARIVRHQVLSGDDYHLSLWYFHSHCYDSFMSND